MLTAIGSNIGLARQVNEDLAAVHPNVKGHYVAIIADGVGGHQAGEVASAMALDVIFRELSLSSESSENNWQKWIEQAIHTANREIYNYGIANNLEGMGTTIVVVAANDHDVYVGHVGDSRLYHYYDGQLVQRTEDHTLVQQLVKNGQITSDEAFRHPQKNIILRALGTDPETIVDISSFTWSHNDGLLLCTDGLSDRVEEDHIAAILFSQPVLEDAVNVLISRAVDAGGEDDITVILLQNTQQLMQPAAAVERGEMDAR